MAVIKLKCTKDFRLSASSSQGLMAGHIGQTFDVREIDETALKLIAGGYLEDATPHGEVAKPAPMPVPPPAPEPDTTVVDLTTGDEVVTPVRPVSNTEGYRCRYPDCETEWKNLVGRNAHEREKHPQFTPE